jgi:hypothetical protein
VRVNGVFPAMGGHNRSSPLSDPHSEPVNAPRRCLRSLWLATAALYVSDGVGYSRRVVSDGRT